MIKDLEIGNRVNDIFYVKQKTAKIAKNGSIYYSVILQDMSGIIDAKIWDITNNIEDFDTGNFVQIAGTVNAYKDAPQIIISAVKIIDKSSVNIENFCPKTPKSIDDLVVKLNNHVESVNNIYLNKLLKQFFNNEKFLEIFKNASGAKTVHHAYVGGLLEHSVTVADICKSIAPLYPVVNIDLLITAALCHDIGKIKELSAFPENNYTDIGNLLGHIYLGTEMIDIQARKIENFPKTLLNELKHCILAHHGELEYGSPQTPKLIEAQLLYIADSTDAKMRRFSDLVSERKDYSWSEQSDFFMGTRYRATNGK